MDELLPLCVPSRLSPFLSPLPPHPAVTHPPLPHLHPDFIFLFILVALTTRAKTLGRPYAWAEPIVELPWFGQWPGYPEGQYPGAGAMMYPQGGMMMMPGYAYPAGQPMYAPGQPVQPGYVVQQNPGHSVVIQPGVNGQAPTITQVPGTVSSL